MKEGAGFFHAVSEVERAGVSVNIVHGGVTTLQSHSFGRLTVRMTAEDDAGKDAVENFYRALSTTTEIEEIR
jgi:D-methionine transport system ATP-binding protein